MKYTRNWLIEEMQSGRTVKFMHFWGHQPSADGSITSSCFSQWWSAEFMIDNIRYKTAEHYMMAEKARVFGAEEIRMQILECVKPGEAKALGRSIPHFDSSVWDDCRFEVVVAGNLAKFSQNAELENFLVNTGDRIIVEASPVDAIWGSGHAHDHRFANHPENWRGLNLLGFALMEVRDQLKAAANHL